MTLGKRVNRLEDRHGGDPYAGACETLATLLTKRAQTRSVADLTLSIKELEHCSVRDGPPAFVAKATLKARWR